MPGNVIRFGTSGWRGIIADDFTFHNVRAASSAIAHFLLSSKPDARAIVGYDTRFLSEQFAAAAAEVLISHGIRATLCTRPDPTPALSFEIRRGGYDAGVNFTASHNPALYNGLKFSTANGAPALSEVTREVESLAARVLAGDLPLRGSGEQKDAESSDPRPPYLNAVRKIVDFDTLRKGKLRVGYDPLFGTGWGYLDTLLEEGGVSLRPLHNYRDVLFAGQGPDPSEKNLAELGRLVREEKLNLGLATDGDADRFGMVDADGSFIQPNFILALLLDYLIEVRKFPGGAGRSVASTHLVDAVAAHHGVALYQTPVGFKYVGQLILEDKIALGGEESAGLSVRGHIPEKDGILACLLVAEMVAHRGQSLGEQIKALYRKVGEYHPVRLNFSLDDSVRSALIAKLDREHNRFNSQKVRETDRTDGLKMILEDGSWVLFRMSGTEPLCRCYCEAHSLPDLDRLTAAAKRFIFDD
ncbi:MAG: phosphoglucomutase/phosphomannomutase family protein [Acidobacteria bacterium]|nr:phosphoglucomutase/phosphomannomutase family protein [Acidobacteriota bacterium]